MPSQNNQYTQSRYDTVLPDDSNEGLLTPRNVLIGAGLLFGGKYAYDSGLLRPFIKAGLELADSKLLNKAYKETGSLFYGLKDWSSGGANGIMLNGIKWTAGENSLFRDSYLSGAFKFGSNLIKRDMKTLNSIFEDTADDWRHLKKIVSNANDNWELKNKANYNTTTLAQKLKEARNVTQLISGQSDFSKKWEGAGEFTNKIFEDLIESNILTDAERDLQFKRTGYSNVRIGELIDMTLSDDGRPIAAKKSKIYTDILKNGTERDADGVERGMYREIQWLLNSTIETPNGSQKLYTRWDDIKNMVVDSSLLIDESGKIVDTRMNFNTLNSFIQSLANDFQIPVVGFNPLKQLGLDKVNIGQKRIKPRYGVIHEGGFDSAITGYAGDVSISDVWGKGHVAVVNDTAYKFNPSSGKIEAIADGLALHNVSKSEYFGFDKTVDRWRLMSDNPYSYNEVDPAKRDSFWERFKSTIDMGNQEISSTRAKDMADKKWRWDNPFYEGVRRKTADGDEISYSEFESMFMNKDNIYGKIFESTIGPDNPFLARGMRDANGNIIRNIRTQNSVFGANFTDHDKKGNIRGLAYYATKKGYSLKDIFDKKSDVGVGDYLSQWFVGRRRDGTINPNMTEKSTRLFGILNGLDQAVSSISGLGFSTESKGSTLSLTKNFILKRALPVYMAMQVPGMINYYSEAYLPQDKEELKTGNKNNLGKVITNHIIKPVDLTWHSFKDTIGLTKFAKRAKEITQGSEQIGELPGIYHLGFTQTREEREEYIKNGVDPIRKGRYWSLGNTPITGGKIEYYRPNLYRRINADVAFSNSKYGSRGEYYSNTWYPNLVNPLAPINHFITQRHHYDLRHYEDRPYLQTGSTFSNIPIIGSTWDATLGRIFEPKMQMHRDEFPNGNYDVNPANEIPDLIKSLSFPQTKNTRTGSSISGLFSNINQMQNQVSNLASGINRMRYRVSETNGQQTATGLVKTQWGEPNGAMSSYTSQLVQALLNRPSLGDYTGGIDGNLEIYTTPGGGVQLVNVPDTMNLFKTNQSLMNRSIRSIPGIQSNLAFQQTEFLDRMNQPLSNDLLYKGGVAFKNLTDVAGLKGFEVRVAFQKLFGHEINENASVIEDSSYAYSFNRTFWDANLGGAGGEFSEIFRRFVPQRDKNTNYVNPIRNTMPSWLPGSNYFTDFLHGDPYTKVANGEERLPGEGYERMYHIDLNEILRMDTDSGMIGKSKEEIMRSYLHLNDPTGIRNRNDDILENQMKTELRESGIAVDTDIAYDNKQTGIRGKYGARIIDPTSYTGQSIADIKVVDSDTFDRVKRKGPDRADKSKVNYELWQTGNTLSNGYLYYINRDDPSKRELKSFTFNQNMLKQDMEALNEAKREIRAGLKDGSLGRGELYGDIDRLRILADVAPYSEEYRQQKSKLSRMSLNEQEREEVKQIAERVRGQKEPIRVYDYKFSKKHLTSEYARVTKVLDNNHFLVNKYGKEHAIRLAGISVSNDYSSVEKGEEKSKGELANKELRKYIKPGMMVRLKYDADELKKFQNDSLSSINASVTSKLVNVNKHLLDSGLAKERERDDSAAGIYVRYSGTERLLGKAWEKVAHANIPFFNTKVLNVKSPYESYKKNEVYDKNFKSWNTPIKSFITPMLESVGETVSEHPITGMLTAAFLGSLFGRKSNSRLIGAVSGMISSGLVGMYATSQKTDDSEWIPERRQKERNINEYIDTITYIKNMKLYSQYKEQAKQQEDFDVDKYLDKKERIGGWNKSKRKELEAYKKKVKVDYHRRFFFDFKKGRPKYASVFDSQEEIISGINKEINELNSERKVERLTPLATKAIQYKTAAEQTMYGFDPGESVQNLLKALPKKDRQYFKYFVDAPKEEREKILRIVPDYMKRGLQSSWGLEVDQKPSLTQLFQKYGLPDENWAGWKEEVDLKDIKVKMIGEEGLDYGEFNIWDDDRRHAKQLDIDIPILDQPTSAQDARRKLEHTLGVQGMKDIKIDAFKSVRNRLNLDLTASRQDALDAFLNDQDVFEDY